MNLPEANKVVVNLSGGLDSTILTYVLVEHYGVDNVFALSFNYGQKQSVELQKASTTTNKLGIEHNVIDITFLGDIVAPVCANITGSDISMPEIEDVLGDPQPPTYVPYRNLILSSLAFSYAEANECSAIFTGLQSHDLYGYWDTSVEFIDRLNQVSQLNRQHSIKVHAPFVDLAKVDEINIAEKLNVPYEDSLTCYEPIGDVSCGKCPSCAERIQNFIMAGIKDPAPYVIEINWG
jgi:7-cyano-7-deazaguanine synthase